LLCEILDSKTIGWNSILAHKIITMNIFNFDNIKQTYISVGLAPY